VPDRTDPQTRLQLADSTTAVSTDLVALYKAPAGPRDPAAATGS
jgi:hypothetical protein